MHTSLMQRPSPAWPHNTNTRRRCQCTTHHTALPARIHTPSPQCSSATRDVVQPEPVSTGESPQLSMDRRGVLKLAGALLLPPILAPAATRASVMPNLQGVDTGTLEEAAFQAYADRDFQEAVNLLSQIINKEPSSPRWLEMRAQVLCDGKNFDVAIQDFDAALRLTPESEQVTRARLLAGRGLACEGEGRWEEAKNQYTRALDLAAQGGSSPDPYVINSRGNCYNSLGMWKEAREDYLVSSQLFQQAKGFKGANGSSTARLDGAIFSASNAALMLAQMGDEAGALKEMERIARRAPGSVDMRAALSSLYWAQGRSELAEDEWAFACTKISTGCTKYTDVDWLSRIRRWPPVMVSRMQDFVQIRKASL